MNNQELATHIRNGYENLGLIEYRHAFLVPVETVGIRGYGFGACPLGSAFASKIGDAAKAYALLEGEDHNAVEFIARALGISDVSALSISRAHFSGTSAEEIIAGLE